MSGSRAKTIRKLLMNGDPNLLMTVRRHHGELTQNMEVKHIYRVCKKLWLRRAEGTETWFNK